jgi:hypothetical protein
MRLDRNSVIAGRPAKEVRDGLRRLRHGSWSREGITHNYSPQHRNDWLKKPRRIDPTDALLDAELIEQDKERTGCFRVTDKGLRLACASLLPPITRAKADALMAAFLQRVVEVNTNDNFCEFISEVDVYGSYITDANILGDIDLNVTMKLKEPWPEVFERWKQRVGFEHYYIMDPRRPSPEREVRKFLRARCPYLHIDWIPWSSKDDPPDWPRQRIFVQRKLVHDLD